MSDELSISRRSNLLENLKKSLKEFYELDPIQFHQVEFDIVARGKEHRVTITVDEKK